MSLDTGRNMLFELYWHNTYIYEPFEMHGPVAQHFFIQLFIRIAGVSYGRFLAVRFGFSLSTYIQNRWW